ncbi:MAG: hypothetical protein KZQ80_01240 [Candidatus Thiodiazotropha sp. (ex Monitilora ramsayi)]|nr:hypothetical protein [Candidatus Thiodiazotropha sp. (ex Monitilora ramsayi)]
MDNNQQTLSTACNEYGNRLTANKYDAISYTIFTLLLITLLLSGCGSGNSEAPGKSTDADNKVDNELLSDRDSSLLGGGGKRHAQPVTVDYPETGVDIGWGWDSEQGTPRPSVCIEFSVDEDQGQTKYMTISEVSDSYELMKSMKVSAAASVKTAIYSASGSAEFASNSKVSGFSSNFLLTASVDNGVRYATPMATNSKAKVRDPDKAKDFPDTGEIRLTPEALRLAKQRSLDAFFNRCGDSFVAALYGGARLHSVITVEARSRQDQQSTSAHFTGSGWGANVKASASGKSDAKVNSNKMSMRFFQTGGRKDKIPATKEDLVAKLDTLTTEAGDYPTYYRVSLMPYTALANWPDKPIELATKELDQLAAYFGSYNSLYQDMEYLLEHHDEFQALNPTNNTFEALGTSHIESLRLIQDQVHHTLSRLRDDAIACSDPEQECHFDETRYLPPYAYRIQLPLPAPAIANCSCTAPCKCPVTIVPGDSDKNREAITDYHVRGPAKNRCKISPLNDGCLSNAQIEHWSQRIGKKLLLLPDEKTAVAFEKLRQSQQDNDWLKIMTNPPHAWVEASKFSQDDKRASLDILRDLLNPQPPEPAEGRDAVPQG